MTTPHQSQILLEGKKVDVINQWGSKNYSKIPASRELAWKISKMFGRLAGAKNLDRFVGADQFIVEKYKETYVPGIGNDAIHKLNQKGYSYRDIARKIGRCLLYEINIHTAKRFLPLNNFVDTGYDKVWDLVTEVDATNYYTNALAQTVVGTGSGAENDADDYSTFTSPVEAAMEATYPLSTTSKRVDFKGSYGSTEANQAWQEAGVGNGEGTPVVLNRIVADKGTKSSGETWTSEIRITGA